MKKWFESYRSKFSYGNKPSIAKDETTLLAERLEFFVPRLSSLLTPVQWALFIFAWSMFLAILTRNELPTWQCFVERVVVDIAITSLILFPSFIIVDYLRPSLKRLSTLVASIRIVVIVGICAIIAKSVVMLLEHTLGWANYATKLVFIDSVFAALVASGFAWAGLLYFSRRHQSLMALKLAAEQNLAAQNDLIKARISPHFFFNTINTLMSLIESNPHKASELLEHVSALFRASFNGPKEISLEEEVALCKHYLNIEHSRLDGKLQVEWLLPEEDIMYDMVITSLTLQSVLEQILLNIVEMSMEMVVIKIVAKWDSHHVCIKITAALPAKTLFVTQELRHQLEFEVQTKRLQSHFGKDASIESEIQQKQIVTHINYPLHDPGL